MYIILMVLDTGTIIRDKTQVIENISRVEEVSAATRKQTL